ncbi:hypothetical protein NMY22_g8694 [Coprinellus aureogranulatus]|nr:hypothetical protein NMY22_g8694 [Coprinellus aureogranulatus]
MFTFYQRVLLPYDPFESAVVSVEKKIKCPKCRMDIVVPFLTADGTGYLQAGFITGCPRKGCMIITKESLCARKLAENLSREGQTPDTYLPGTYFTESYAKTQRTSCDLVTHARTTFLLSLGPRPSSGINDELCLKILKDAKFSTPVLRGKLGRLAPEDVEMEDLNYYYANYSRIYNDVITLRKGSSYMTKLSLSHALSQSVKISLFEDLISTTVEETKDIPEIISETGKIGMPHKEIMQQIGQLFLLRTNINSVGSVLDSPEVFWSFPDLQPLYDAARSYLEIPQRINLLNTRVEVLQDMLQLLKETVSSRHSERLEQIVIALIGIEIVLGIITILVDVMA